MNYDVVSAEYLGERKLKVAFEDGKSAVIDFSKYIRRGGVFRQLADIEFFKQFKINKDFGALCWGDELDIAPETLYREATENGTCAKVAENHTRYGKTSA